jgi:heme A synthase
MTTLQLILVAASLFAVVLILLSEAQRVRGTSVATINPKMLLLRITLGIIFAILGVVGSILPIMQGWIFFLLAGLVLFPQSRLAIRALEKAEPKFPRLCQWLRRLGVGVPRESHTIRR